MSVESPAASRRNGPPQRSPLAGVPSWVLSLLLHAALIFFFATRLLSPSVKDAHEGDAGGFREVGIVVKSSDEASEFVGAEDVAPADTPETTFAADPTEALQPPSLAEAAPSVPLSLPQREALPALGAGATAPPPGTGRDVGDFIKPSRTATGAGAPGDRPGTSFSGINDHATQVIYVVDCSHSMDGLPLGEVKLRLLQSVEQLDKTQRFQIIFYNNHPHPMTVRGGTDRGLYWATDINKTQARQHIEGRLATGGTEHMPALVMALKLSPEVLYFLTDAQDGLSPREMDRIRRLNKGTRIHCIEFGEGPALANEDNFLKRLAREHGGSHTYQDVTRFGRR